MRHGHWTVILYVLLSGCAAQEGNPPASDVRAWDGEVQVYGTLRAMLHEGRTEAMVKLDALLPNADLYAVGALADLAGEVTIVGGKVYLSYPVGEASRTETPAETNAGAALLVTATVLAWRSVSVQSPIRFAEIDAAIAGLAATAGSSPDMRFPFLVEGEMQDLQWHVIDGARLPAGGTSHADHFAAAAKDTLEHATATLIGFYSKSDQGIFTHMGSRTHIHCVMSAPLASGHVDHVVIPAGATVRFPAPRK